MKDNKSALMLFLFATLFSMGMLFFGTDVLAYLSSAGSEAESLLNNPFNQTNIRDFVEAVIEHLQAIIAFLSIIFIVIGGVIYTLSAGNQKMVLGAKICIVGAIIGFALAAAGPSFLRQIKIAVYGAVGAAIPTDIAAAPTMAEISERVLTFLLSIVGMLGIIGLTISGIMYIFATGDSAQAQNAKNAMKYAIMGIVFAGASLLIVRQIVAFF